MVRVLIFDELVERGIRYSRHHLRRKVRDGSFPAPIRLGDHRIAWHEEAIDTWLANRPSAAPDGGAAMT